MDIAVVGAGPAGAFCAERLARAGCAVTVYDPSHPREKPCGGGVTPTVFERFPELAGLRSRGAASHVVRIRGPAGRLQEFPLARPIDVFSRRVLDGALLERALTAGSRLCAERVTRVAIEPRGVALAVTGGTRRHDAVVGADGAASIVRRSLLGGRPGGPAGFAANGFHVEGLREEQLYVEFVPEYAGYLWVFPRPGHASVGIVAPLRRESGVALRRRVLALLEARYAGSLALARRPYAASIPCPTPAAAARPGLGGPRFLLVGDAANAVDAITGEGIRFALDSAAAAADALVRAGPLDAAADYARHWQAGPGRELVWAARLARHLYRPSTVRLALASARRSRRLHAVVADMLAARLAYTALPGRLLADALGRGPGAARGRPARER